MPAVSQSYLGVFIIHHPFSYSTLFSFPLLYAPLFRLYYISNYPFTLHVEYNSFSLLFILFTSLLLLLATISTFPFECFSFPFLRCPILSAQYSPLLFSFSSTSTTHSFYLLSCFLFIFLSLLPFYSKFLLSFTIFYLFLLLPISLSPLLSYASSFS